MPHLHVMHDSHWHLMELQTCPYWPEVPWTHAVTSAIHDMRSMAEGMGVLYTRDQISSM